MELTPKSMSASSPPFRSTSSRHMALNPADYPTPPYSQPQTEAISSHSPPNMGLGIMNSDVESYPQIEIYPASQQHQLQSVPRWPQECTPDSSHAYSTLSSSMSYTSSPMFTDLGGLPSVSSSPYALSSSNAGPTSSSMFLDPNVSRSGNDHRLGQFPSPYNHIPRSRPESPPKEVPRVKQESESGWPSSSDHGHGYYDPSKESATLTNVTQQQGGLQSPYPMTSAYNQSSSNMLMEMNHNVKREHSSKPSQESFVSQASSAMSGSLTAVSGPPVYAPKPRRKTTPENAKQACTVCGMLFTRLSNCTAHMETHNPERKRPHKCTMAPCKKKFSRKTDLIRHVDSVHHKIKRYGCELCGQRFARGDTLRRHCMDGCKKRYRSSKNATSNAPPTSMPSQVLPASTADLSSSFPSEQQAFSVTQFPLPDYYDNSRSYVRAGYMSNSP